MWENICKILDPDYIKYLDPEETKKKKKKLWTLNSKKKNLNPIRKWAKDAERLFTKAEIKEKCKVLVA